MEEENRVNCAKCKSSFDKMFLMGKQGNTEICPMCGAELTDGEEHPDWITWYYYKSRKSGSYILCDKLPLWLGDLELVQEFKAPPSDAQGSSDKAKEILRKYVPDAFPETTQAPVSCPWCGSSEYSMLNGGGFFGGGRPRRVCNRCRLDF